MTETTNNYIITLLHKCGININTINELDGYIIERSTLLNDDKLDSMDNEIKELRKCFTSSTVTALQKTARTKQKWPLLNMVRQLLKTLNYNMVPFRKSNGYDQNKKKIFIRYFKFEKIMPQLNKPEESISNVQIDYNTDYSTNNIEDNDNQYEINELSLH